MASTLASALLRRGRNWAGQITSLAKSFAPNHLKNKIHSSAVENKEGQISITTTVKSKDARAQEFGSGLWAQKGSKHWILIRPKDKGAIWFPYPAVKIYPGARQCTKDGKLGITTHEVHHPGIHAVNNEQGYIRPAMAAIRKKGRQELSKDVRQAILGDLNMAFKTGKK